jgi:hypothetical protein
MAASHPEKFKKSSVAESDLLALVEQHLLPKSAMLQWRSAKGEDIPTPNTKEIVILTSLFQCGFGLLACEFLHDLLHHYQVELVHLNPNSILQIAAFIFMKTSSLFHPISLCLRATSF